MPDIKTVFARNLSRLLDEHNKTAGCESSTLPFSCIRLVHRRNVDSKVECPGMHAF